MNEANELLGEFLYARAARDDAQAKLDEIQSRLIKQMQAEQRKSFRWTEDGLAHSVTYVQKSLPVVDEAGLRKALTAKVFDKYTKRVLDRKAMESAMDAGAVDPITVSRFVTMKPSRAYLDYREREAPETTNTAEEI